jgi:hypothetical protein
MSNLQQLIKRRADVSEAENTAEEQFDEADKPTADTSTESSSESSYEGSESTAMDDLNRILDSETTTTATAEPKI